jgi:hypothetical protein
MAFFPESIVVSGHPDFRSLKSILQKIEAIAGGDAALRARFPALMQDAIDFVLDPVRTARTRLDELDKVEKTFVGLKVEHFVRDMLGLPKGRRDLKLKELDLDIKHTIGSTWMIPPETYDHSEPCLLIATAKFEGHCSLGLMIAHPHFLGAENRDRKRGITLEGRKNILWFFKDEPFPPSRWDGTDMGRFLELRKIKGGKRRAAQFFRENLNRKINRVVIQSLLHDQRDYMKRVRGNGGARDDLIKDDIILLSGVFDRKEAIKRGIQLAADEFVAIRK